jgi:hypothetical protein
MQVKCQSGFAGQHGGGPLKKGLPRLCSVGLLNVNTDSGGVTESELITQNESNRIRVNHLERSGQRTGYGILLIVGVVILRYEEITLVLSGGKREH